MLLTGEREHCPIALGLHRPTARNATVKDGNKDGNRDVMVNCLRSRTWNLSPSHDEMNQL